jgi:hypothetical protein
MLLDDQGRNVVLHTAEGSDRGIDRLDEDAFAVDL